MKTVLRLPYGFGRAHMGDGKFTRAEPVFDVRMLDDEGNNVTDAYPSQVRFGPELYRFLRQLVPAIAARRGEDNVFEGIVDRRPSNVKEQYAYYGVGGVNPLTGTLNPGLGLMGFGDNPHPNGFGANAGKNMGDVLYVRKANAPSPIPTKDRSGVLTNILNGSQDFNPFFAPVHKFVDPDYDPKNDPEGKGPRPTDVWVPRKDPATGHVMTRPDGSKVWMPVPRTQPLPIYNFSHPKWEEDPEAAWDMVRDAETLRDWKGHGIANASANFEGETRMSKRSGEPFPYDFYENNLKVAATPGYYDDDPGLRDAYEKLKAYRLGKKWDSVRRAREDDVAGYQDGLREAAEAKKASATVANDEGGETSFMGRNGGTSGLRNRYRGVINAMLKSQNFADRLSNMGVTKDDRPKMLDMIMRQPDKYNKYANDDAKMLVILDDYGKERGDADRRGNIVSGVSGL